MTAGACILGCAGPELGSEEQAFFRDMNPWGFILFARNVQDVEQVRRLTAALRAAVGRDDAPVMVDQEGGRVQRLRPPVWPRYPSGRAIGSLGGRMAVDAARLHARLIAHDLRAVGIDMDSLPLLDVTDPEGHEVIGDRAYGDAPDDVSRIGAAVCEGLLAGGVLPVLKHMPGHGRARVDSHAELPVVDAALDDLQQRDFAPFRALADMPAAMTAHVIYAAVDPHRPATISTTVFEQVIRGTIGFDGLVMSDDIGMNALSGGLAERAKAARAAGCDLVLHGSGDLTEMREVAQAAGALEGSAGRRAMTALSRRRPPDPGFDPASGAARFAELMGARYAA